MDRDKKLGENNIEKVLMENFVKLMPTFYEMQSNFLSGVYKRYGDLEGGNIVIFFARDLHLEVLRQRENDLNFSLSLEEFWNNHRRVDQKKKRIIYISQQTGLPKETARRKLISLIKKKHIKMIIVAVIFTGGSIVCHTSSNSIRSRSSIISRYIVSSM